MPRIIIRNGAESLLEQEKMKDQARDLIELQRINFNEWLKQTGHSVRKVADRSGLTEGPIRRYKNGASGDMRLENKIRIAEAFSTTVAEIFGDVLGSGHQPQNLPRPTKTTASASVPVIGRVDNFELFETNHPVAFVEAPPGMALSGNVYALRTPNTANMPRFRLREILLCNPDDSIGPGDDCAIHLDDTGIHILRCIEYTTTTGFTGTTYAEPDSRIYFENGRITKAARIVGILVGA